MPTLEWANPPVDSVPKIVTESPGPRTRALHEGMERHQRGSYTIMVAQHPVAFDSGHGVVLRDVDGNEYISAAPQGGRRGRRRCRRVQAAIRHGRTVPDRRARSLHEREHRYRRRLPR